MGNITDILTQSEDELRALDVDHFKTFSHDDLVKNLSQISDDDFKKIVRVYFGVDRKEIYRESQGHLLLAILKVYQNKKIPTHPLLCKYIIEHGIFGQANTLESLIPYYSIFVDNNIDQYVNLEFRTPELENQFVRFCAVHFQETRIQPYPYPYDGEQPSEKWQQLWSLRQKWKFSKEKFSRRENLIQFHRAYLKLKLSPDDLRITIFNRSLLQVCDSHPKELLEEYIAFEEKHEASGNQIDSLAKIKNAFDQRFNQLSAKKTLSSSNPLSISPFKSRKVSAANANHQLNATNSSSKQVHTQKPSNTVITAQDASELLNGLLETIKKTHLHTLYNQLNETERAIFLAKEYIKYPDQLKADISASTDNVFIAAGINAFPTKKDVTAQGCQIVANNYLNDYGWDWSWNKSLQSQAVAKTLQEFYQSNPGELSNLQKLALYNILKPYVTAYMGSKHLCKKLVGYYRQLDVESLNEIYQQKYAPQIHDNTIGLLKKISQLYLDRFSLFKSSESALLANTINQNKIATNPHEFLQQFRACLIRKETSYLKNSLSFLEKEVSLMVMPFIK